MCVCVCFFELVFGIVFCFAVFKEGVSKILVFVSFYLPRCGFYRVVRGLFRTGLGCLGFRASFLGLKALQRGLH